MPNETVEVARYAASHKQKYVPKWSAHPKGIAALPQLASAAGQRPAKALDNLAARPAVCSGRSV